ncbi:hypothetical protein FRC11_009437 [Ceratobasidium sp. 423]|nr:hypothetical protein FRC11_009437 [Ceratobasidium sp. 423]
MNRATYERVKLLGLKQAEDVPVLLLPPIPEPLAHIDPPQHYFNFDEGSIPSDRQLTTLPPPSDVEPPPPPRHFLTHVLFNAPHVRFSAAQQKAILDWAIEMGTPDVPSLYALSKCDEALKAMAGDSARMYHTRSGSIHYLNPIDAMVQQDPSNPHVRSYLEFYPEDAENHSSEVWHGEKLAQGHNRKQLTPMVTHNTKTYFIDEVCELVDVSLFIPDMFLRRAGEMRARGNLLAKDTVRGLHINAYMEDPERISRPLSDFQATCGLSIQTGLKLKVLMLLTTGFDKKVQKVEQKTSNFWDWIGQQVVLLRTRIATNPKYETDQEHRQAFTQVFTRALARHRTKFPPPSAPPPAKPRPAWQETLEDVMKLGSLSIAQLTLLHAKRAF